MDKFYMVAVFGICLVFIPECAVGACASKCPATQWCKTDTCTDRENVGVQCTSVDPASCLVNGECAAVGNACTCKTGFVKKPDNTICLVKAGATGCGNSDTTLRVPCTEGADCTSNTDPAATCTCKTANYVADPSKGTCVVKADSTTKGCGNSDSALKVPCTEGAVCSNLTLTAATCACNTTTHDAVADEGTCTPKLASGASSLTPSMVLIVVATSLTALLLF